MRVSYGFKLIHSASFRETGGNGIIGSSTCICYSNNAFHILACSVRTRLITVLIIRGAAMFYGLEDFTFSESVYFVDITVTTVGFGDDRLPKSFIFLTCSCT